MKAVFTPGPWSVGGGYLHKTLLLNAAGNSIASGGNNRCIQGEELEASLCLAATAPNMLAALKAIVFQVQQGRVLERDACITAAREVIALAERGTA